MNERRLALAEQRGELKAKIREQRETLARHSRPLKTVLGLADQAAHGVAWAKQNPAVVAAGVAGFLLVRPRRAWRWGKRAFLAWRGWRSLRQRLDQLI